MQQSLIEEYQLAVRAAGIAAMLLAQHDVPRMLAAIRLAETVGPIADPTLYIRNSPAMREDKQLLEAGLPLWNLARAIQASHQRTNDQ